MPPGLSFGFQGKGHVSGMKFCHTKKYEIGSQGLGATVEFRFKLEETKVLGISNLNTCDSSPPTAETLISDRDDQTRMVNTCGGQSERKNIWVAAGDGDLDRVKVSISQRQTKETLDQARNWSKLGFFFHVMLTGLSPTIADENSYTPLHAAASWGRLEVLRYLHAQGADMNTTDEEGELTEIPILFLLNSHLPTKKKMQAPLSSRSRILKLLSWSLSWAVTRVIKMRKEKQLWLPFPRKIHSTMDAAENVAEDYPEVCNYLRGLLGQAPLEEAAGEDSEPEEESGQDPTNEMTQKLIDQVREMMTDAETNGVDSDSPELDLRLRELVTKTVDQSVGLGKLLATAARDPSQSDPVNHELATVPETEEPSQDNGLATNEPDANKRQRT
ncbi:hypothetical protein VP01_807g6 [Puccinia sorghi]|uniref:Uncharacterized protein n=1 Tax=Puccinia sorghi TaxID=27349 RepID=A0A0L6UAD8_9BASI|nr:hypothetical protein VP01_807g6 [Puccinia sorghi]